MSSRDIYSTTTPYFYIIKNKLTNIRYAGSRWNIGCHPDELLQPTGYQTSSNTIHQIIKEFGLGMFTVEEIVTDFGEFDSAYDYETNFLVSNNCAGSKDWYNGHNNSMITFMTQPYFDMMDKLYGVSHPMESPLIVSRINETNLKRYGNPWVMGSDYFKTKTTETLQERYGKSVTAPVHIPGVLEKMSNTYFERTGYYYPTQNPDVQAKSKETWDNKTDDELLQREHRRQQTCIEHFGVDSWSKTEEGREVGRQNIAVVNDTVVKCEHCGLETTIGNYNRWHGDNCLQNPNNTKSRELPKKECLWCKGMFAAHTLAQFHGDNCLQNPANVGVVRTAPKKECPHCKKMIAYNVFERYHNHNCKLNPNRVDPDSTTIRLDEI